MHVHIWQKTCVAKRTKKERKVMWHCPELISFRVMASLWGVVSGSIDGNGSEPIQTGSKLFALTLDNTKLDKELRCDPVQSNSTILNRTSSLVVVGLRSSFTGNAITKDHQLQRFHTIALRSTGVSSLITQIINPELLIGAADMGSLGIHPVTHTSNTLVLCKYAFHAYLYTGARSRHD